MAAGADLSRVSIFQMGSKDEPVPFRVPQDADELGRRVAEKRGGAGGDRPADGVHRRQGRLAQVPPGPPGGRGAQPDRPRYGCAVLVVYHLNKGASTDPLLRHEGSAAFTQVVRGGLMLGHDPDDPDGEDGEQRVLAVSSSNLAAIAPSLVYRIDTARVTGDTGEEITTARMVHIGESARGRARPAPRRSRRRRAHSPRRGGGFLLAELAEGTRLAGEVKAEARKLGLSDTALFRARQTLGVKASKTGFKGGWEWALPEEFTPPEIFEEPDPVKSSGESQC